VRLDAQRHERHGPQQLDREPRDLRRRGFEPLDEVREERGRRAAVLRVRVPRAAREVGRHETVAVRVEHGIGELDVGHAGDSRAGTRRD
jgi:hypothetical protein